MAAWLAPAAISLLRSSSDGGKKSTATVSLLGKKQQQWRLGSLLQQLAMDQQRWW
jgi:hypothetical protein